MSRLLRKFRRDIIGLVWGAAAIFLILALASYSPLDASFNSVGSNEKPVNLCGYFGSFMADALYQFLGLSSWLFVLGAARLSYFGFSGREVRAQWLRLLWASLLFVSVASLLGLYAPEVRIFNETIALGGAMGLAVSSGLVDVFNFMGVAVILWTSLLILVVFYTERSLSELLDIPLGWLAEGLHWLRDRWAAFSFRDLLSGFKGWVMGLIPERAAATDGPQVTISTPAGESDQPSGRSRLFALFKRSESESSENDEDEKPKGRFFALKPEAEEDEDDDAPEFELEAESEYEEDGEEYEEDEEASDGPEFVLQQDEDDEEEPEAPRRKRRLKLKTKVRRHVENWELPKVSLLEDPPFSRERVDEKDLRRKADVLTDKLSQFSVGGEVVGIKPGPFVTMFEFRPNADVKISKITDLADDLCLALSSESVRIIAPIPGRNVVGIETSNSTRETVYLKEIITEDKFWDEDVKLPVPLGKAANGSAKIMDLQKMPHLMVAGTTGSGKSVFVVSFLTSLLFKHSPKTLRLILVDPKQVDLALFNNIPHLVMPPIRESKKAVTALRWAIREMEKRYRSMSKFGARKIEEFNDKVQEFSKKQIEEHQAINDQLEEDNKKNETYYFTEQPFVVIVVEEFGDLMAVDKNNVEQGVVRLAQMARAGGIHLVLAMQSPRKDVVTGLIKTNIPGRASFKVASKLDSRVILDEGGAERLLSRGDMLFLDPTVSKPQRHHGAWLTEKEIDRVIKFWTDQGEPEYDELAMKALEGSGGGFDFDGNSEDVLSDGSEEYDDRYDEIVAFAATQKAISASLIQRRFRLGYPRAARLIEVMESEGVVGPPNGSKPRQVLISPME